MKRDGAREEERGDDEEEEGEQAREAGINILHDIYSKSSEQGNQTKPEINKKPKQNEEKKRKKVGSGSPGTSLYRSGCKIPTKPTNQQDQKPKPSPRGGGVSEWMDGWMDGMYTRDARYCIQTGRAAAAFASCWRCCVQEGKARTFGYRLLLNVAKGLAGIGRRSNQRDWACGAKSKCFCVGREGVE